jgi:uncharacterized membrane protein
MTIDWWTAVRFLHIIGAILWIGGQLTFAFVITPGLRSVEPDPERLQRSQVAVARRFGIVISYVGIPLMLATGFALSWHVFDINKGGIPGYGFWLGLKIVLFLVAIGVAAVHGVLAARGNPSRSKRLADVGLVLSLGILLIAVDLGGG